MKRNATSYPKLLDLGVLIFKKIPNPFTINNMDENPNTLNVAITAWQINK